MAQYQSDGVKTDIAMGWNFQNILILWNASVAIYAFSLDSEDLLFSVITV